MVKWTKRNSFLMHISNFVARIKTIKKIMNYIKLNRELNYAKYDNNYRNYLEIMTSVMPP